MIVINPTFKALIPPLSDEEREQLEANLLRDGCREPLVIWRDVLVDGHNRYEICQRHNIPFNTVDKSFLSEDDAKNWIIYNQLGRRNISPYVRTQLSLLLKPEIERQAKKHQGKRNDLLLKSTKSSKQHEEPINTRKLLAKLANVSPDTVMKVEKIEEQAIAEIIAKAKAGNISINAASKIADLPEQEQKYVVTLSEKEIIAVAKTILAKQKREKIEQREKELQQQKDAIESGNLRLPEGVFSAIVIDPPWNYKRNVYHPFGRRVASPYPSMSQDELLQLKLPAADDCVLFLWTTHAFMFDAKQLLDKWGFTYKAVLVWDKERLGVGSYLRMQCEFCLVAIKGKPIIANTTHRDIIRELKREHSRKPEAFYKMVEKITVGKKLDYFSREKRKGWASFGADADRFSSNINQTSKGKPISDSGCLKLNRLIKL